jgi:hypothetical protein
MIKVTRQGIGSAVVRVDVEHLEGIATEAQQKLAAKRTGESTMAIAGWTGRIVAERATLDAERKFYSVTVRRYNS